MEEMNLCFPKWNVNEHKLFHGTRAAQEIIRNGFSIAKSSNKKVNIPKVIKKFTSHLALILKLRRRNWTLRNFGKLLTKYFYVELFKIAVIFMWLLVTIW